MVAQKPVGVSGLMALPIRLADGICDWVQSDLQQLISRSNFLKSRRCATLIFWGFRRLAPVPFLPSWHL
jgi:hypothetical protein